MCAPTWHRESLAVDPLCQALTCSDSFLLHRSAECLPTDHHSFWTGRLDACNTHVLDPVGEFNQPTQHWVVPVPARRRLCVSVCVCVCVCACSCVCLCVLVSRFPCGGFKVLVLSCSVPPEPPFPGPPFPGPPACLGSRALVLNPSGFGAAGASHDSPRTPNVHI